jgi:histidine triad (HIT) family protein
VRAARESGRRAAPPGACAFCDIVAGRAPASRVWEDRAAVAFMDINPVRPGHLLVIPRAHRAQLRDLAPAEAAGVGRCLPRLARALAAALEADGVQLVNLNGPAAGQTVFHVHVHLIPVHRARPPLRRRGRRISWQLVQRPAPRAELDRIAALVRHALAAPGTAPRVTRSGRGAIARPRRSA